MFKNDAKFHEMFHEQCVQPLAQPPADQASTNHGTDGTETVASVAECISAHKSLAQQSLFTEHRKSDPSLSEGIVVGVHAMSVGQAPSECSPIKGEVHKRRECYQADQVGDKEADQPPVSEFKQSVTSESPTLFEKDNQYQMAFVADADAAGRPAA